VKATETPARPGFSRFMLYMLLMGVLAWWLSLLLMPLATRWEFAPATVERLPFFGFGLGVGLGFWMALSRPVRDSVFFAGCAVLCGWLVWFSLVYVVGLGLSVGGFEDEAFEDAMEWVDTIAAWIGILVAATGIVFLAYATAHDGISATVARFRSARRKTP